MLTVPAGKVLVREGERGNEFMIISEGEAEVRQGGQTIARIGRGGLVGEMALLEEDGRGRRNATVTTVTNGGHLRRLSEGVPPDHRDRPLGGREGAADGCRAVRLRRDGR